MTELKPFSTSPNVESAFLVGVELRGTRPLLSLNDSLEELTLLAKTAGIEVVGQTTQTVQRFNPATLIGKGKVEEVRDQLDALDAQVVIFDDELSPRHQRELEKRFGENIKLLDRSALILDIFAQHARTREGAMQVELAQYEYRLPRLTRQWTHLARQAGGGSARGGVGGVGLRGPGETQLEVDRREIQRKISKLKSDIQRLRIHRQQYRANRRKSNVFTISLVGYTNAGKSTLLKALSGDDIYIADQLFATLDPTTRRVELPLGQSVVFTDTVGFIQKLPTTLIAAFQATLEEIVESDLLLHLVDRSHPNMLQHIEAVEDTLAEIEVPDIPRILVWNKIDKVADDNMDSLVVKYDGYVDDVFISASENLGIDLLMESIDRFVNVNVSYLQVLIPYDRGDVISSLYNVTQVEDRQHVPEGVLLKAQIPTHELHRFQEYIVENE